MGLFDIFKSRGKKEETSKVSISVEFTEEEIEAINKSLETYNSFAAAEGKKLCVVPKLLEAMKAQGLFEYAFQLVNKSGNANLSNDEVAIILDKAIKAQLKAHCLHNLPLYLFHLALIYELAGNAEKAQVWFKQFLQMQNEFKPDKVDEINLNFLINMQGFDLDKAVESARQKLVRYENPGAKTA
jgi:tetratricopeptide (TPR) repeat protein